jgi:hypothetical protein
LEVTQVKILSMSKRGAANLSKLFVLLAVGAVLTVVLGNDGREAGASHTEILASKSSTSPNWASSYVLVVGGDGYGSSPCEDGESDPTTGCLYVWAKNVDNSTGASAFHVEGLYDSSLVNMLTFAHSTVWLGSTGRSVACASPSIQQDPLTGYGEADVNCNTLLPPPPLGPKCPSQCSGLLTYVAFESRDEIGTTVLNMAPGSLMLDTPADPDDATQIPALVRSTTIVVAGCANFLPLGNPDQYVLVGDVLYVVNSYYTPIGDLDGDGNTLVNDILIAVAQYYTACQRE